MKEPVIELCLETWIYKFHDGILEKVEEIIQNDGCTYMIVAVINGIPESAMIVKPCAT